MILARGQITISISEKGDAGDNGEDLGSGKMLYRDPEFRLGTNRCVAYNNLANSCVVLSRIVKPTDCPTTSTHCLEVKTVGLASPKHGGYYQTINSRSNAIFIQKVIAKIPSGYILSTASNHLGDGSTDRIIGNNKGTGRYEVYLRKTTCGTTGTFSNGGHLYLSGNITPTPEEPLIWHIASSTVYDMTDSEKYDDAISNAQEVADAITEKAESEGWATKLTHIDANGIFTGKLSANTVTAIKINASQITAGVIDTARLNVTALKASLITADNINALSLDAKKGKIGGWTINSSSISNSNIVLDNTNKRIAVFGASSSSTSGHRVQLYYSSTSSFGFYATNASGNCIAQIGSANHISGWLIDANYIRKNSVYLGADGSIYNGTKWRLDNDGSGIIANGNISWDSLGKVTFSPSVSLSWTAPIGSITTALGGGTYPKLTNITSTGIYTGTLTATQINAVSISASSIKTGTLSADRIATGSITSTKLDANSIKANIINTTYINGLSCAFTKGTIGGWTIGSGVIYNSNLRLDNTNRRIVVYGASAGPTSGHRVQMYYNSNTDFGLFATGASGSCVAQFGSNNSIAGWSITDTAIHKNSVYLGADGSIYNGSKWRLNNDGSGQLASGNISWNTGGAVTFSSAVSLIWKNDIEAAKSTNYGYRYSKDIIINGESGKYYPVVLKGGDQNVKRKILINRDYSEQAPSDWNTSTHKGGLTLLLNTNFGGWGGANYSWEIYELEEMYCRMFAGAVLCGNSCMFAIFLRGGGTTGAKYHIYSDQPIESDLCSPPPIPHAPQIAYNSDRIFLSGSYTANAPAPRTLTPTVEEEIRKRRFISLAQGSDSTLIAHPLTYIGSTGIYTGTLTANQVNAVGISASSITTGTLSADRIAAGSITSAKLDATSIKANIINTSYISGLSCTFSKGKIGGWSIGSDNLTNGIIGGTGIMPMQLRTTSIGSGYWYSGTYKPSGISITWHQSANAGHIVIGQIAASGSSVKTGFVGIQMMSWDHQEYFCLSANYTRSGSKEVYNRIAGWGFDSTRIWKNSVSLGSDGSITNSTKWQLNNDGSGCVANGNISWNSSGVVSVNDAVSVSIVTKALSAQVITTNKLNVTSGATIGGFKIEGDTIRSKNKTGLLISPSLGLSFSNPNIYAVFGNYYGSGGDIPMWIDNKTPGDTCTGMAVSASGAANQFNNIAIDIMGGCVSGFAVRVRKITARSTTYLNNDDVWVSCHNTTSISIYLPDSPPVGKVIYIKTMSTIKVYLRGRNSQQLFLDRATSSITVEGAGTTYFLIWDSQYWCCSRM